MFDAALEANRILLSLAVGVPTHYLFIQDEFTLTQKCEIGVELRIKRKKMRRFLKRKNCQGSEIIRFIKETGGSK